MDACVVFYDLIRTFKYGSKCLFYWGSWEGNTTRWVHLQDCLVALWELDHRSALCKSGERDVCSLDSEPFLKGNQNGRERDENFRWPSLLLLHFLQNQMFKQGFAACFPWADWVDSSSTDWVDMAYIPWLGHQTYENCALSPLWTREKDFHILQWKEGDLDQHEGRT